MAKDLLYSMLRALRQAKAKDLRKVLKGAGVEAKVQVKGLTIVVLLLGGSYREAFEVLCRQITAPPFECVDGHNVIIDDVTVEVRIDDSFLNPLAKANLSSVIAAFEAVKIGPVDHIARIEGTPYAFIRDRTRFNLVKGGVVLSRKVEFPWVASRTIAFDILSAV